MDYRDITSEISFGSVVVCLCCKALCKINHKFCIVIANVVLLQVMFGVTHACAVDGFSGMIVAFVTMPVKNNLEIYAHLFK